MKISLQWLNEYVDLKDLSVDEIVDKITYAGIEVEEVVVQSDKYKNMVVGLVKDVIQHPNADKLSLCIVNDGELDYRVVCGAPNVAKDQKIAFAKVGSIIPSNGKKLEKVKIRGEVSTGMICSEYELESGDNHEGILVLDENQKVGSPLSDALEANDIVFEVAITPNRCDALSHIGIARDLAAIFNRKLKFPEVQISESIKKSDEYAKVVIEDKINCPRYVGKVVMDVNIQESPKWLQKKLKSIGLRPINNVVDVTNFVLHEIGQPLHAFDLDRLFDKKIVVKLAKDSEKFSTLDSKERNLNSTDLMICDGEKSVAIAGVMGGENSEVTNTTKNILIESAFFNPSSIRKTAKRLGLSTDASYRFERGTDYNITVWAARRAAQLIQMTSGGEILNGEIDTYPNKIEKRITNIRFSRLMKVLGYSIQESTVENILNNLGFEVISRNNEQLELAIPSYRHDIEREIDVIEEVARIYGFEKIPDVHKISVSLEEKVDQSLFTDNLKNIVISLGFYELVTNSLLNESISEKFGKPIKMLNPQSSEMSHLRPSLLPGMLQAISNNIKVGERNLKFFEIGKVFELKHEKEIESFDDFLESEILLLALSGNEVQSEWYGKDIASDFYGLKGYVNTILQKAFPSIEFELTYNNKLINYEYDFIIKNNNSIIGYGGKLRLGVTNLFDTNQEVYACELNIDELRKIKVSERKFKDLLKFPKVIRDFAFVLDSTIESDKVIEVIKAASSNLLHQIKLFDIFQSDSLGKDKKSLAFQLEYFDETRTLKEEEVEKDFRNAIKEVEKTFKAQLRGI
jgi:phenylalanyl-tRNA synthetase beta chain